MKKEKLQILSFLRIFQMFSDMQSGHEDKLVNKSTMNYKFKYLFKQYDPVI